MDYKEFFEKLGNEPAEDFMKCPKCSKEMIPSGSQYYDCNAWVCDCGYEIPEWGSYFD